MNGHSLPAGTPAHPRGWHEFCELHAISTAKELARHYLRFATEHPHHDLLAAENFSVHFTDLFQQYFCHEVKEGIAMNQLRILPAGPARDYRDTHQRHADASLGTVATKAEAEPSARPEQPVRAPEAAPAGLRKSWSSEELAGPVRRPFSLSQLRRSWRSLFRRRSSDALPGDGDGEAAEAVLKPGLGKRILPWGLSREQPPEVRKEGLLKYGLLDESSLDSGTRWQRCRLLLRRAAPPDAEEFLLELFDPPKGSKPKLLVACSAVQEVRRCTRLEMPDNLHTFVLKVGPAERVCSSPRGLSHPLGHTWLPKAPVPNFSSSSHLGRGCTGGCGVQSGWGMHISLSLSLCLSEDPMSLSDVPQVTNATDILFEAGDEQQLSCWTAEIRECVHRGSDTGDPELLTCRHPDPTSASPTASTDPLSQGELGTPRGPWGQRGVAPSCRGWADWPSPKCLTGGMEREGWGQWARSHFPGTLIPLPGRGDAGGPGGGGGAEDGAVPLLVPLVPRAHLPCEGSSAGAAGGAGGPRRVPGAAERDAPRRVRAHLQLPGQSQGTGLGWDGMGWDGMGWDGMGWDGMGWDGMG
uniref:SH2B adaptor protein 3 n=1 Tax=Ficedula albicollis TaxID=59894 RepID=A0A803VLL6_FICAL